MKHSYRGSFTALLTLALFAGAQSPAVAQDQPDATNEPRPTPTSPGAPPSAIEDLTENDQTEICVERDTSLADRGETASAGAPAARETTLGTDARIDTSRVNCLDEHNDAPHQDNLRLGSPNTSAPADRTDIIITEDQRNSANGN